MAYAVVAATAFLCVALGSRAAFGAQAAQPGARPRAAAPGARRAPAQSADSAAAQAPAAPAAPAPAPEQASADDLPKPAATPPPATTAAAPRPEARLEEATDAQTAAAIRSAHQAAVPMATRSGEYDKALLFSPEDNKVLLTNPQIKWELTGGRKINLGGIVFSADQLGLVVSQTAREKLPRAYRPRGSDGPPAIAISFRWPEILAKEGNLLIVGARGEILWRKNVEIADREDWKSLLGRRARTALAPHYQSQWGEVDVDPAEHRFLSYAGQFRACFQRKEGRQEKLLACSGPMKLVRQNGLLSAAPVAQALVNSGVSINGAAIGDRGIVNFPPKQNLRIKVAFSDGSSVAVSGAPLRLNLLDAVRTKDGRIKLMGQGPKPVGQTRNLIVPANHFWAATGADKKTEIIWEAIVAKDAPTVRVLGSFNLPFTYIFQYDDLPNEADRAYISSRGGNGTYVDGAHVKVFSPPGDKIVSGENSVSRLSRNVSLWRFKATDFGKASKSRVAVLKPDGKKWIANYEMRRAYPFEASARLTAVATPDLQTIVLGELAGSAWFEDASFVDSYWLGRRRWGASFRYFQSLTAIDVGGGQSITGLRAVNADYKYNFIPGLWNRDELFGLMISFQNLDVGGIGANLGGFGAYWARTMPKVFDDIFNLIPAMRYPKYVDVEFIYYPIAVLSDARPGATYNLNFHGKVFWTKTFFGEAGFGIRQYVFDAPSAQTSIELGMGYGTLGLGWIF